MTLGVAMATSDFEHVFGSSSRWRAAAELGISLGLIELDQWYVRAYDLSLLRIVIYSTIAYLMVLSHARRTCASVSTPAPASGFRTWAEVLAVTLVLSIAVVAVSNCVRASDEAVEWKILGNPENPSWLCLFEKLCGAFLQQMWLAFFVFPVFGEVFGCRRAAVVAGALLFGLLHLPSPALVGVTILAGVFWLSMFQRTRRIAPLVCSHIILATMVHSWFPERLNYDMQVGLQALMDQARYERLKDPAYRRAEVMVREGRKLAASGGSGDPTTLVERESRVTRVSTGRAASSTKSTMLIVAPIAVEDRPDSRRR